MTTGPHNQKPPSLILNLRVFLYHYNHHFFQTDFLLPEKISKLRSVELKYDHHVQEVMIQFKNEITISSVTPFRLPNTG